MWTKLRTAMEAYFQSDQNGARNAAQIKRSNIRYHDEFESEIYARRWRQRFDRLYATGLVKFYERFLDAKIPREGRILDVGCGVGRVSVNMGIMGVGQEIHGLDISKGMLAQCRGNASQKGVRLHLTRGDVEGMPYQGDLFDAVFGTSILHHVPRPERVIQEAYRLLKPGGFFLFEEPNRKGTINALILSWYLRKVILAPFRLVYWIEKKLFPNRDSSMGALFRIMEKEEALVKELGVPPDVHVFTTDELSDMAAEAGFHGSKTKIHSFLSGIFLLSVAPFIGVLRENHFLLKVYDVVLFSLWVFDQVLSLLLPRERYIMIMISAVK